MARGDKPWPSGSPCPGCSALSAQLQQAEKKLEEKRQDLVHAEARLESVILQRERERDAAIEREGEQRRRRIEAERRVRQLEAEHQAMQDSAKPAARRTFLSGRQAR